MAQYLIGNFAAPTTAKVVAVATGTTLKTLLQVVPSATKAAKITEWGFKCDAPSAAALCSVELLQTDVAATSLTAHVAAGIQKYDADALIGGDPTTNLIQVGTSLTGYTAGAEGTITATRMFDMILTTIPTTNGYEYVKQFPLGREPVIEIGKFGRIRVHMGSAGVNALCYMIVEV
jgi:hypothetical protein